MFDVGFSELIVIGIVALVVIGPERLPRVARTAGVLFGRLQRYVAQVKSDINREMELAELGKVKSEFESAARSFESQVRSGVTQAESELTELQSGVDKSVEELAVPAPPPSPQLELAIEEPAAPAKREAASG